MIRRALAFLFLALAIAAASAQTFYWENPRPIVDGQGRYPSALPLGEGFVVMWQESEPANGTPPGPEFHGRAWLSLGRIVQGRWEYQRRFAGPYEFRGAEPILYSAAVSANGRIAVVATGDTGAVEILVSEDGARSFARSVLLSPLATRLAPRIYPSASGGWIVFSAQVDSQIPVEGSSVELRSADQAAQAGAPGRSSTLPIYFASSYEGRIWSPFSPLIQGDEGLDLNFLPYASPLPQAPARTDIVVFQSFSSGDRPTFQLWAKTSTNGGRTWSRAKRLSDFEDPTNRDNAAPANWDNQRPALNVVGGKLWLAWERSLRGGSTQVYVASIDGSGSIARGSPEQVSTGSGTSANPQLLSVDGQPGIVWFSNRSGQNRVYLAILRGVEWKEEELSKGVGEASFGRAVYVGGKAFAVWQSSGTAGAAGPGEERILVKEPDTHAEAPRLSAIDFTPGKRSRRESVAMQVGMPDDSSGIQGFSYLWSRDPKAEPPRRLMNLTNQTRLAGDAPEDGAWYLSAAVQDFAGNWSPVARLRYDRKRTPPDAPAIERPVLDERGFLASNSFSLSWAPPLDETVAGYTWDLRYVGPLSTPALEASLRPSEGAKPLLPELSAYEAALIERAGLPQPPPAILGTARNASWSNIDDGYYLFSLSSIDDAGNISAPASILVRADKFIPYTTIGYADAKRDDFGRTSVRILGRGFLAEGSIERIVLSRRAAEPYDFDRSAAAGDYRILSDREIAGFTFEDAEEGTYRIGLYHSKRGWYWTKPIITVSASGTFKYGLETPYEPSWKPVVPKHYRFSIYDAFVLAAVLFAGLGVLLSLRQVLVAVREGAAVRLQVLALVSGGPMPSAEKVKEARRLRRRGTGLRVKFTFIIATLVMFVVLMVTLPLGLNMLDTQRASLARGLQQRANVLLESVASGARAYLPTKDVLQLGFLPGQKRAMEDALYITLTGYASGSTEPDAVWASNDPDLKSKIDAPTFAAGEVRLTDDLTSDISRIVSEIDARARAEVGDIDKTIADLNQEGRSLIGKADEASKRRLSEISASATQLQNDLNDRLLSLSDKTASQKPAFDSTALAMRPQRYLFYKPVLYRGSDQIYYRGMVRLEISTERIVAEVQAAQAALIRISLIIAAIALGVGVVGAFILSTIIVVPIRKLVTQIERIRDTEDKEDLAGQRIEVASRDELYTLADTVNQMTDGLVKAAKAGKELIVGKGIQKMFIPLDAAPPPSRAKLSTGRHDEKEFEVYGYYEGAKGVSGDYWDFKDINARYHYFIKCDISGKGVSAALIMVQVATMVINYFNGWKQSFPKNIDLTDLAYKVNDFIEERGFGGTRFAAFTVGVWDAQGGVAYIVEAGDRKLHVWDARRRELVEETLPDSPAAGIFPSFMVQLKTPYTQITRPLASGDVLFLYTDGIEEAKRHFRDKGFAVEPCAYLGDPYAFLADYIAEKLKLKTTPGLPGPRLLDPAGAASLCAALSKAVAAKLAERSALAVSRAVVDDAAGRLAEAYRAELARGRIPGLAAKEAKEGIEGTIAFLDRHGRSLAKRAFDEALPRVDRLAEGAFLARPDAEFLASALAELVAGAVSGLADRAAERFAEELERASATIRKGESMPKLRPALAAATEKLREAFAQRTAERLGARLRDMAAQRFSAAPAQAHMKRLVEEPPAEFGARLAAALEAGPSQAASEELARLSAGEGIGRFVDELINRSVAHENHKVGEDNEEFGYDRVTAILEAVDARGSYNLHKRHNPLPEERLGFDFSSCAGTLEEKVLALIAVEKVYRMYPDPAATDADVVLVDEKVDAFLMRYFDQYRLYCGNKKPYIDPQNENPGYLLYAGMREDDQYDDLTILAIRRK